VGTFGVIATEAKKWWKRLIAVGLCVLIPFSRLYLGVHTPADVLVGAAISLVFLMVLRPFVYHADGRHLPKLLSVMLVLAVAFVAYMELFPFPADVDTADLLSARKNSYTLLGALLGMMEVCAVDRKRNFPTEGIWYAQVLKTVLGLALVLLVKEGLKAPLEFIFSGHMIARAVRYCAVVLTAGILWPMSFARFAKLGRSAPAE
jgi:hypothetical protein